MVLDFLPSGYDPEGCGREGIGCFGEQSYVGTLLRRSGYKLIQPDLSRISSLLSDHGLSQDLVKVRLSSRAKRLIFKSSLDKGIEIVVPHGADIKWIVDRIANKTSWISSFALKMAEGRKQLRPGEINLKALCETWTVNYMELNEMGNSPVVSEESTLTVGEDSEDISCTARNLQRWLRSKAELFLVPWLESLAKERGLSFNQAKIKNQVSRWGSCSEKRNINLNQNLLFLPSYLVEYALHHELTHLVILNHSEKFWNLFSAVLPNCKELRTELSSRNFANLPLWSSPNIDKM